MLQAHDLDARRCTGIARYATGLAAALRAQASDPGDVLVATTAGHGVDETPHQLVARSRKALYARWQATASPRIERLLPPVDVVHVTAPVLPVPTRRPLVVTFHDVLPHTHPAWYGARERYLFQRAGAWARRRADAIAVPTHFVADEVAVLLPGTASRIAVTGEGFLARSPAADTSTVLARHSLVAGRFVTYVGSTSPRKNLGLLLDAWAARAPELGDLVLVLVGPAPSADHPLAARLAARDDVRHLGPLPDDELTAVLGASRALLHAAVIEGFGLTLLEAMALGVPVFTGAVGGVAEVVGDAVARPSTNDLPGWLELLPLLGDDAALADLAARGRLRAEQWSWPEAARRTNALYQQVA